MEDLTIKLYYNHLYNSFNLINILSKYKYMKNYQTQRNIPCYENAQKWYFINALEKMKSVKNLALKAHYKAIANYYLNGNVNNVKYY